MADILRFPGVVAQSETDAEGLQAAVLGMLSSALSDFNASRQREGEKLAQHLLERLAQMRVIIEGLQAAFLFDWRRMLLRCHRIVEHDFAQVLLRCLVGKCGL